MLSAKRNVDITKHGSGNPGTMNMARTLGWKYGVLTMFCDIAKASAPCLLGAFLLEYPDIKFSNSGVLIAGISAILGHMFPVFRRFRGGKGAASSLGVFLALDWRFALGALGTAALVFFITRYGSVMSIVLVMAMTLIEYLRWFAFDSGRGQNIVLDSILLGFIPVLIIFAHRGNLKRLSQGSERRMEKMQYVKEISEESLKKE